MKAFIKTYWFFIGIAIVVAAAFQYPMIGVRMKQWHILRGGIFLAFLIAGLTLETRSIFDQIRNVTPIVVSLISSLVFFPLLALLVGRICFPSNADFFVGLFILAVAPVTIASGTIMTAMAGGNVPLSLFICVVGNFCAIFTVPVTLNLLLQIGQTVTLPTGRMIQSLVLTVLVPILIGQVLRIRLKDAIQSWNKAFSIFAQCLVLLIICYAVASSTAKMATAGYQIIYLLVIMTLLHVGVLGLNYGLSKLARFDAPSTAAFTIHTSQKTLTISYLVWAGYFASTYPMALIPSIGYHLVQMVLDTAVAHRFKQRHALL